MSEKRYTLDKSNFPEDDYSVIARLTPFTDQPYGAREAATLSDFMHLQNKDIEIEDDQLFVQLRLGRLAGEAVWKEAAYALHQGLARMAISPVITAGADITSQICNAPTLTTVFPKMDHDITIELCKELSNLAYEPLQVFDFDLELQHLVESN